MLMCRNLQSLSPVSLPAEAKRDCQGPLCKSLEHSTHSVVSIMAWDGFQRPGPFHNCLVCLFLLPSVVCCSPWLWCLVLRLQRAHREVQPCVGNIWGYMCMWGGDIQLKSLLPCVLSKLVLLCWGPWVSPVPLTGPDAWPKAGAQEVFVD